ncbi:MAG TPA: hypothetical protein VK395_04095 [Gemmataceae bacterium]|nr:hypothetical protein [Gemmataceae bacterium]
MDEFPKELWPPAHLVRNCAESAFGSAWDGALPGVAYTSILCACDAARTLDEPDEHGANKSMANAFKKVSDGKEWKDGTPFPRIFFGALISPV